MDMTVRARTGFARLTVLFAVSALSTLISLTSQAADKEKCGRKGYCSPSSPDCPWFSPNNSWRDYLSRRTPNLRHAHSGAGFSVEFRYAREINDPPAIGYLDRSVCYHLVAYGHDAPSGYKPGYFSFRAYDYGSHHDGPENLHPMDGLLGDPDNYEINIEGVLLTFNDAGEVIDRKGHRVGQLMCWWRNECGQYL